MDYLIPTEFTIANQIELDRLILLDSAKHTFYNDFMVRLYQSVKNIHIKKNQEINKNKDGNIN